MMLAERPAIPDVVGLHCPLTPQTRHGIDATSIAETTFAGITAFEPTGHAVRAPTRLVARPTNRLGPVIGTANRRGPPPDRDRFAPRARAGAA